MSAGCRRVREGLTNKGTVDKHLNCVDVSVTGALQAQEGKFWMERAWGLKDSEVAGVAAVRGAESEGN